MGILVHTCPHCRSEHISLVIGQSVAGPQPGDWNALLTCPRCRGPACATFRITAADLLAKIREPLRAQANGAALEQSARRVGITQIPGDPTDLGWKVVSFAPEVPKPRVPDHLPAEAAKAFLTAERIFPSEDMEEASAGSYRRALDVGTKLIASAMPNAAEFEGKQLNNRIDMLRKHGRLTQDLADWSHQIKGLGNEAMHAMDGITRMELVALRGFTEMVLTYLFTLPSMLAERKKDADAAKG